MCNAIILTMGMLYPVRSQATNATMSARVKDVPSQLDIEQFDCISSGEVYRAWRRSALRVLSGKVDKSGSSLADRLSRRARLDASLLACRASATRSLSKSAKVSQTCCPFHSLFPDLPGLALLRLAPPLLSLLPRLQRHGILLRKKRRG